MIFEWDENKNQTNIAQHGFSFDRAKTIFDNITYDYEDTRKEYGEKRIVSIGLMEDVVVIVATHTNRNGVTRLISARSANKKERNTYEAHTRKNRN